MTRRELRPVARLFSKKRSVRSRVAGALLLTLSLGVAAFGIATAVYLEQLAAVLRIVSQHESYADRVGVCLDTAHLWGAGHDISTAESTLQVLRHFDETVGLQRLKVIHLNDTKMALSSHRDVHARLGEGIIGEEGLHTLLTDPRLAHVAVLLETPIFTDGNDKENWEHDKTQIAKAKELTEERM